MDCVTSILIIIYNIKIKYINVLVILKLINVNIGICTSIGSITFIEFENE